MKIMRMPQCIIAMVIVERAPEIIVPGLSDGTLKLFDIRTPKSGAVLTAAMAAAKAATAAATPGMKSNTSKINRGQGGNLTCTTTSGGTRIKRTSAAIYNNKTFNEHGSWIVDVSFSSFGTTNSGGSQNEILSGSVAGDIRAWDIRSSSRSSLRVIELQRSPMPALSEHKKIPIAETGSHAQFIKILTLEGETLQVARFHEESLPGHRIGPVSCLEFHKHKLVLAAGSTNALVSVYQPQRPCT
mmetsp:Transcript_43984/g.49007  ORF Transcript_43984/g.49007 Transcript_43984/m.49007 type:complete len:243 (+) Transcript_43984:334-1062(+)